MPGRVEDGGIDIDAALARLARETGPSDALVARVLADAAMVSAERHGTAPPKQNVRPAGAAGWFGGLFGPRSQWAMPGALAALALSLVIGLGVGYRNDSAVLQMADLDRETVAILSPLDGMEDDVIAVVDEDFFGLDAPL